MVKLINKLTNTEMLVNENRKDEYLSAGHKLADTASKELTNKTATKRTTTAKK